MWNKLSPQARPLTSNQELGLHVHAVGAGLGPAAVFPSMLQEDVPDHQVGRGGLLWRGGAELSVRSVSRRLSHCTSCLYCFSLVLRLKVILLSLTQVENIKKKRF